MTAHAAGPAEKPVANSRFLFLKKFLRHGTSVASVAPSSRSLGRATAKMVDPDRPQTILELGAGTGAITRAIVERMHPQSRLIAVEIDQDFAAICRQRFPQADVLTADVTELRGHLQQRGISSFDLVVSGLPTPSLPRHVNAAVLQCVQDYAASSYFSQLTVMPLVYWPMYKRLFERVKFVPVLRNIPCAGVYHCQKLRPDWQQRIPGK